MMLYNNFLVSIQVITHAKQERHDTLITLPSVVASTANGTPTILSAIYLDALMSYIYNVKQHRVAGIAMTKYTAVRPYSRIPLSFLLYIWIYFLYDVYRLLDPFMREFCREKQKSGLIATVTSKKVRTHVI